MAYEKAWLEKPLTYRISELPADIAFLPGMKHELEIMHDPLSSRTLRLAKASMEVAESFEIRVKRDEVTLLAADPRGFLYGLFSLQREVKDQVQTPAKPLRMINHWDNMDGSVERGYAGRSLFFEGGEIILHERQREYARLLASVGINAISFNNVNVDDRASRLLLAEDHEALKALSQTFLDYGIMPYLSLNFASPMTLGGLDTCDPLDPAVIAWWESTMEAFFNRGSGVQGFVVKADSEGRPGPFTYGRTQAEGANMLARILKPYGAKVIWRAFVYNCQQDWRDRKTDRARAAYDYFAPLDGAFEDNVYLQIKHGPIDFQVREPISPLFYAMKNTNLILELQVTQEYTGQQIDLCYLGPMWQAILAQDLPENMGIAAVSNVGRDENWFGHVLAGANLFAYGNFAWDPQADSEKILHTWFKATYGVAEEVPEVKTFLQRMLGSWRTYEKYTTPLGVGFMVTPHVHYGPSIEGYEFSRWGTYHRANREGIGIDRTVATGTGYAGLYPEALALLYENPHTCPDDLLLFFHHVPYDFELQRGTTVLQDIYNHHFEGYDEAVLQAEAWDALEGFLPQKDFQNGQERFARQLENAREWRDQINTYFYRFTGIPDEQGRTIYP